MLTAHIGRHIEALPNIARAHVHRIGDGGTSSCSVHTLADGSSLATETVALEDGGVTSRAEVVRVDGTAILMHVSNDRDPKGRGGQSAPRPPLTIEQLTTIVTSPIWPPR